jgi:Uma2 family endonuclease
MNLVFPEKQPVRVALEDAMSDDEFWDFCVANPDVRFERTAEGEIIIVPPAGMESDYQNLKVAASLDQWAMKDGRGKAFGPSLEFILPTGAAYSPDAAWVSHTKLAQLTKDQKRKFPPVCPEFIVEVMSPSDRLPAAKKKMQEWMRGGVELGWLIHADKQQIYIYRAGQPEPELRTGIDAIDGEGPVVGFHLDLGPIWAGL